MFSIILFEPEIPPNTGNIIRLCANTGCQLHLIEPLGFAFEDKQLRRAGLDYHDLANVSIHPNISACLTHFDKSRIFALSAKGKTVYTQAKFQKGDAFMFGPETRGLPKDVLSDFSTDNILRIPQHTSLRSLNLSNSAAIMIYEAWRQFEFIL